MRGYLNQVLEYLPDRLAEPPWKGRCRMEGLDGVLRARQNGRPVILAFFHFSAYRLARIWLRSAGVPAAALLGGKAESRAKVDRLSDQLSPFPEVPTVFYQDQLREVNAFLAGRNTLLIALDAAAGKQMNVPVCAGWIHHMATGAVRLAIRHRAELIPIAVIDEGRWRYHVILGHPVPAEYLAADGDCVRAGKHLLDELLPHFRNHTELCTDRFARFFQPAPPIVLEGKLSG